VLGRGVNGGEFPLPDRNGNTAFVTGAMASNGVAVVKESYRYDAFGAPTIYNGANAVITSSAIGNRFLFTGREYNSQFGFYEYRARAYHPGLGRFMSEDPKGFDAGDYNWFRYCENDPWDKTDPTGEFVDEIADAAFITYDIGRLIHDGGSNLRENLTALGLDAAGAALPFVTGLGPAYRASRVAGAVHRAEEATKAGEGVLKEKAFTRAQKREILQTNREKNAGELRSDKSGQALVPSKKSERGVTPPQNEAQVDHVYPRSKGGSNAPDNSQVLSRQENRKKSDVVPIPPRATHGE
jgi:RHS repeat-associated protein